MRELAFIKNISLKGQIRMAFDNSSLQIRP